MPHHQMNKLCQIYKGHNNLKMIQEMVKTQLFIIIILRFYFIILNFINIVCVVLLLFLQTFGVLCLCIKPRQGSGPCSEYLSQLGLNSA